MNAAVGRIGVAVFAGQVQKAGLTQRQADVARQRVHVAVARKQATLQKLGCLGEQVPSRLKLDRATGAVVVEDEVHDPRDRVGPVLGGRAVAQDLSLLQRECGDE